MIQVKLRKGGKRKLVDQTKLRMRSRKGKEKMRLKLYEGIKEHSNDGNMDKREEREGKEEKYKKNKVI